MVVDGIIIGKVVEIGNVLMQVYYWHNIHNVKN